MTWRERLNKFVFGLQFQEVNVIKKASSPLMGLLNFIGGDFILKRIITLFLSIAIISNAIVIVHANDEFFKIANESAEHTCVDIKATDIKMSEKNEITFKNSNKEDTNTYILNDETVYSDIPDGIADLSWFLDGRATYITVYIYKTDFYEYSRKQNEKIYVSAVGGFYSDLVDAGKTTENKGADFGFIFAFNIMQTDEFGGFDRENITRAEMAQILVNMLHLRQAKPSNVNDSFYDVPKEHWAYNAINICKQAKYINGYGNGYYGVDDKVTYEQVVKMLVSVLGYASVAEKEGGYPKGYIKVANDTGVTQNISFTSTDIANRKTVAKMIINAVHIPVMEQIVYAENPTFAIMNGTNGNPCITFFDKYFVSNK